MSEVKYRKHNFQSKTKLYAYELNEMDDQIVLNSENIAASAESVDKISKSVAYINETQNETVMNSDISMNGIIVDGALSTASANPVQNKVVTQEMNTLSARMDTFTNLAEGSTTGDAELADIRVGYDGTTYSTAGEAVRSQVAKLSEEIDDSINSKAYFSSDLFEVGAIYETGENADLVVAIRSKEIMTYDHDIVLQVEDGWRYNITYYHEDGVVQTGYLTTDEIIFAGTKFRLVIRKVSDLDSSVHFDMFTRSVWHRYGTYLQDEINARLSDGVGYIRELEHCRYTAEGEKMKDRLWVGTRNKCKYTKDIIIYMPSEYLYSIIYYNENGDVERVQASTSEYTKILKGKIFTFNVRLNPTSTILIKDVFYALKVFSYSENNKNPFESVGEYEYGRIDENGALVDSEWWGRTKEIHSYDRKTILSVNEGFVYSVLYYDENKTFVGYTPSTDRDIVIPANAKFRICVRKHPTASATLVEYKDSVKVSSYIIDEKPSYDWWEEIKGVGHAGCESYAPQNTMSAYKKAVELGLKYIESDVRFTSDNVPVMLHSATIDATSNGTGAIAEMTYEQALQYDFGSYFSSEYAGEKIPTLRQFCEFCRATGTRPYIEIKTEVTEEQANIIKDILTQTGIIEWVTFPVPSGCDMIWKVFNKPRMLFILFDDDIANMDRTIIKLKSYSVNRNVVACFYKLETMTEELCNVLVANGIPVHAGSSDSVDVALACPAAVTEFAGSVNFPEVLKQKAMQ